MRSLYESIMQSRFGDYKIEESILDSDEQVVKDTNCAVVWNKTKPVIDGILNAASEFPMEWFLEGNNLRLDNDTVKKIVKKLKKALPERAIFGSSYGIKQIAKQYVEQYGTAKFTRPRYAYYKIEITYGTRPWGSYSHVSETEMEEFLIYLTDDYICALDIPETKSILTELDTHFAKYVTQDEVKLTDTYKMKSKIGGKYRVYSFKDLKKEFIARK